MESMQRLAKAVNKFAWRANPDYPFKQRPVVHITTEPSIEVRPFKKQQIEKLKSLTEGPLREALSRHFKGVEFEVRKEDALGMDGILVALPDLSHRDMPTFISISKAPCGIEFNFKRSLCNITERDTRRYIAFIREILGEDRKTASPSSDEKT